MPDENDELKEWENPPEENPPENLKRKWIEREYFGNKTACPACGNQVPAENITCLFCGAQASQDSGPLGKILQWFKGLFR